ncbi:MAG: DUF4910 domain-containing protein [Candidatus Thermoplasmatota archaeon]|nr:DUF4910 domain-containing protein [Candidatus Thermoplasmatota archaeon]
MHELCQRLFPIGRSITGDGVRETLRIVKEHLPDLQIREVPSGTQCFDWIVPQEWNVHEAYVIDPEGRKILDFRENNLHLMGYSTPIDAVMSLEDLQSHLHSISEMPTAIPYVTSYYRDRWGFCLSHEQLKTLLPGDYHVVIDTELKNGSLTYGELLIPGNSEREIFLSTYICHPSMANNELSGPVVTTFLARQILSAPERRFSYRIVFIPETIGSIVYLSMNHETMKEMMLAGFCVTCIGDDRAYSYLPSRNGDSLSDKVALHVLRHLHPDFIRYTYLERGSDERQYCSPGIDLPVASVMRSKYGEYPEYHTSLDNLSLVTPSGLRGGYEVLERCLACIEADEVLRNNILCEPQLGRRGLYPDLSTRKSGLTVRTMMNLIAYCDGRRSMLEIAEIIDTPMWDLIPIANELKRAGVLSLANVGQPEREKQ